MRAVPCSGNPAINKAQSGAFQVKNEFSKERMRASQMISITLPKLRRTAYACIVCLSFPGPTLPEEVFIDIASESGIDFFHFNGMSGEIYFPEIVGTGSALLDYDRDGDLDIYIVQGNMLGPGKQLEDALIPPRHPLPLSDRLYRNDTGIGDDGKILVRFTDVTEESGELGTGYGMGVATGDINNDGYTDLYVMNLENNQLLLNNGDGTFSDVTVAAGVDDPRWSTSAVFLDYDKDGWQDLYVATYVAFDWENRIPCFSLTATREYCGPKTYAGTVDKLFRNLGDGRFEDVTRKTGIGGVGGGLGVVATDFNGDQWLDIYVANDGAANFLWINQQDGSFVDDALMAGAALNMDGAPEASMGVDAADFDDDGDDDLFMTHLARETNTLYINDGTGWFEDQTVSMGLAKDSFSYTGFGVAWFDYDNDGWLDLLAVNGAVTHIEELVAAKDPYPHHQPNQLYRNLGNGHYQDVSAESGKVFELSEVSRGAAFGDIDNDGDTDVLITNNNGPARLLINQVGTRNHWLGLELVSTRGHPVIGARVALLSGGKKHRWR
ncbi:MAG: VCBS repeat-containing protein, partial [Proteobacteria bacterium]|nr:VCBS repeat-containing protein [Pseudomonadota bacterium]